MAKRVKRVEAKRSHLLLGVALGLALALAATQAYRLPKLRDAVRDVLGRTHALVCAAPAGGSASEAAPGASGEKANLDTALEGPVSEESLAPSLAALKAAPEGSTVLLHISSPGGDGFAMLAWLDVLDQARSSRHVKLVCTAGGIVASAAAIIFEACDVRVAADSAVWLFHGVGSMAAGKAGNVEDSAKLMRVLDMAVAVRIAGHLGMTPQQYVEWVDRRDRFLTTAELAKLDTALEVR